MTDQVQTISHGFTGIIDQVQLADLIQAVCLSRMSCRVQVESNGKQGDIYVTSGQVVHAAVEGLQGEEAFNELFQWEGGRIETVPIVQWETTSIKKRWEFLIIGATRLREERNGADVSSQSAIYRFKGTINHILLEDLIQLVCLAQSDHMIQVRSEDESGKICVSSGQVCHSETGELEGEAAFFAIFAWGRGNFETFPFRQEKHSITTPWEYLLMEAMRLQDEATCGADDNEDVRLENLQARISRMKVAEKIRFAMRGDREVRAVLIRDPNRFVQMAIINNPRITETEVAGIAYSRSVDEEVLRKIANNREWIKLYPVRLALVKNPKTPLPIATKLVPSLTLPDLKIVAKSKAVPVGVAQMARKFVRETR